MEICSINVFGGKNIYSYRPTAKIIVDLKEFGDIPTKDISGFNERLIDMFPGLRKHKCALGYEGGFLDRLNEGTYLAHVTEHLIIEIQNMLGCNVKYGKARQVKESVYYIVFEHNCVQTAKSIAITAIDIINSIIYNKQFNLQQNMKILQNALNEYTLGPSTDSICEEARLRGIPITRLGNRSLVQLGYGKYSRQIQSTVSDDISCISADISSDKYTTKLMLDDVGIPVPMGVEVFSFEIAKTEAKRIGYPVVVKPLLGSQGKGVTANVCDEESLKKAFERAIKLDKWVIIEKYHKGNDYRLLVVGDKVCAAAKREPASVIGDGVHTLDELINIENGNILRGEDHEKVLTKIKVDNIMLEYLKNNNIDMKYVPQKANKIYLRPNANLSTGGKAIDCTEEVCEENKRIAILAARTIGLSIAGIDIIAEDISVPLNEQNGAVIEVNASPGIRMHIYPSVGHARNVSKDIVDYLFPEESKSRIPIVSITGTNGKTTTARILKEMFKNMDLTVGMTSTSGVYINDKCVFKGDNTGPLSAKMLLTNKNVEVAVLETARGGIIRRGLAYDFADVGVITNITQDHLGIDGINTMEELAFAKSLVAEAVKPNGWVVLNADNSMSSYVASRVKNNIAYFSMSIDNRIIKECIKGKRLCVFANDGWINISNGNVVCRLISIKDIPATQSGKIKCNIENAMAACLAGVCMNVPLKVISDTLKTFKSDINTNPGRFNIFKVKDFHIMLDYGHNIEGYKQVIEFAKEFDCKRRIGVIGMPGDRKDEDIETVAKMCGNSFDKIYIKEDKDLRGRKKNEVASIIKNSILKYTSSKTVIMKEEEISAMKAAIESAKKGDFIIVFYEDFESLVECLHTYLKGSLNKVKVNRKDEQVI